MQIDYGVGVIGQNQHIIEFCELTKKLGRREASVITGFSRSTIDKLLNNRQLAGGSGTMEKLAVGLQKLRQATSVQIFEDRSLRQMLNAEIEKIGLGTVASSLDIDASNLRQSRSR